MKTPAALGILTFVLVSATASGASVDGAELHWTSAGEGELTMVFVHGWTCDATSWDAQVSDLARDYRVITLDLPGHGQSEALAVDVFSMDLFARAVEAVRVEAGADQIVLVGHSMGTPVIRQYAITYPARVKALVLADGLVQVAGGFGSDNTPPPLTGAAGLAARRAFVASMFSEATTPALREQVRSMMLSTSEATAAGAYLATWDTSTWRNDPVAMPVLALYADASTLANREAMALLYPDLEYHEISGTGHFLMMERPDEFNRLLRTFLERIE